MIGHPVTVKDNDVTCTITNTYQLQEVGHATLTLHKDVSGGGPVAATAWTLYAEGGKSFEGKTGDPAVTNVEVVPGDYVLSESLNPADYNASAWRCGDVNLTEGHLTLVADQTVTCTITNTYSPPGGGDGDTTTTITTLTPAISLVKLAALGDTNGNGVANAGESIGYSFAVTNNGQVALTDVSVADLMVGVGTVTCPSTALAAGATFTCTAVAFPVTDANATGSPIVNEATASGKPPTGPRVSATASVSTPTGVVTGEVVTVQPATVPTKVVKSAVVNTNAPVVAPAKVTQLAFTGAETVPLGLSGLLALLLGVGLILVSRRRATD